MSILPIYFIAILAIAHGFVTLKSSNFKKISTSIKVSVDTSDIISEVPALFQVFNKYSVEIVKSVLVQYYGDRSYARFAALETIARVPYFSYTSVLHLYETLGWLRKKEYIKMHFSESWNELHHLLIMESLGGSERFTDRFLAQHIAFFYYWIVVILYLAAPAVAYNLNMHVERHAFETYDIFLKENSELLKSQPAPAVAVEYYEKGDLSLFDSFHHSQLNASPSNQDGNSVEISVKRRPQISSLYDVFYNICLDEAEHAETMELLCRDVGALKR